jgi:DNA-binding Lrp family transcriptional regulator
MHVSTETSHPQHVCEVDGVGLTKTVHDLIEALCRLNLEATTQDITETANLRDRHEARRELRRLEEAGVVVGEEMDVDLRGTVRKPIQWAVTPPAVESQVIERLRAGSDVPLDPVREREKRLSKLEARVDELEHVVEHLQQELDNYRPNDEESTREAGWGNIDPAG